MGAGDHTLEDMSFERALFLPEHGARAVQLVLSARGVGETSFRFFSQEDGATQQDESWTQHAAGMDPPPLPSGQRACRPGGGHNESPEEIMARCQEISRRRRSVRGAARARARVRAELQGRGAALAPGRRSLGPATTHGGGGRAEKRPQDPPRPAGRMLPGTRRRPAKRERGRGRSLPPRRPGQAPPPRPP